MHNETTAERALAGRWKQLIADVDALENVESSSTTSDDDSAASLEQLERDVSTLISSIEDVAAQMTADRESRRLVRLAFDDDAAWLSSRAQTILDSIRHRRTGVEKLGRQSRILAESLDALSSRLDSVKSCTPMLAAHAESAINQLSVSDNFWVACVTDLSSSVQTGASELTSLRAEADKYTIVAVECRSPTTSSSIDALQSRVAALTDAYENWLSEASVELEDEYQQVAVEQSLNDRVEALVDRDPLDEQAVANCSKLRRHIMTLNDPNVDLATSRRVVRRDSAFNKTRALKALDNLERQVAAQHAFDEHSEQVQTTLHSLQQPLDRISARGLRSAAQAEEDIKQLSVSVTILVESRNGCVCVCRISFPHSPIWTLNSSRWLPSLATRPSPRQARRSASCRRRLSAFMQRAAI